MFIVFYFGSYIFEGYVNWASKLFEGYITNITEDQELFRSVVLLVYTVTLLPIAVNVFSMTIISTLFRFGIGIHRHLGASSIFHIIHLIIIPILFLLIFKIVTFESLIYAISEFTVLENLDKYVSNIEDCT